LRLGHGDGRDVAVERPAAIAPQRANPESNGMTKYSRLPELLFVGLTLAAIGFAVHLSLGPGQYSFYQFGDRSRSTYDPRPVVLVCLLMGLEAVVAGIALFARRPRRLWIRCAIGLSVLAPWTFFSTMYFVHAPEYVLFRHLWAWALVLLLVLFGSGSAIRQLSRRVRRQQAV
jgi:hypothetical protein